MANGPDAPPAPLSPEEEAEIGERRYRLSKDLLRKVLTDIGLDATGHSGMGIVCVSFADKQVKELVGSSIFFHFMLLGNNNETLGITACVSPKIPESEWTRAMLACNNWHSNTDNFGRAYLEFQGGSDRNKMAPLQLDTILHAPNGVTEDDLEQFLRRSFKSAGDFYTMVHQKEQLY